MIRVFMRRLNRYRYDRSKRQLTELQNAVRRGMLSYVKALYDEARAETIKKNKTGRIYVLGRTKNGRRIRHRASAPGESFASRPPSAGGGNLRRSISFKVKGWNKGRFGYGVARASKPPPSYAAFVEGGTTRMDARPALRNAIKKVDMDLHFERAFDEYQAKTGKRRGFLRVRRGRFS